MLPCLARSAGADDERRIRATPIGPSPTGEYHLAPLGLRGRAGHQTANCAHRETALNTSGSIALAPGDAAEERAEVLASSDQNCGAKVMGRVAERFFVLTTARRQV